MTLNLAILIIVILVSIFLVLVEIFTVLFMMTGLTERKARFQVISLMTSTGFTTSESEVIVSSRRRRRLATICMISGYVFTASIVSMMINAVLSYERSGYQDPLNTIIIFVGFIVILLLVKRMPFFRDRFDNLVKQAGARMMFNASSNPLLVLDYYGDSAIAEIRITEVPHVLEGRTLGEAGMMANYKLQVFVIKRPHETKHIVGPDDVLHTGDRIVLFGPLDTIHELFSMRPSFGRHDDHEFK